MRSNPTVALGDTLGLWRDKINLTIAEVNSHVGSSGDAHADVTTTVAGFMSAADKTKLNGVATNANNYTHPATHPASIIVESTTKRFVTDAEKGVWNRAVLKDSETGAALLPVGTEAQRPGSPSNGLIRYNTELNSFEGYSNGVWGAIGGGGGATGGGPSVSYFDRSEKFAGGASGTRTTLNVPEVLVVVNGKLSKITPYNIDINTASNWDTASFATPANRAGKDFYVYAVENSTSIVLSANSTFPTGYTATNTRKIGGFHCLCVSVGTISGHTLSGYIAGDILPRSVWDLKNRSAGRQEGTILSRCGKWIDIYLPSVAGDTLVSVNNGTIADGASSPAFHTYKFEQWFSRQGMSTISQQEFFAASEGCNQSTNITGFADPITTTGHVDTAGRRMISNEGIEDSCGVLWQWGRDTGGVVSAASWANAYNANDDAITKGQHHQAPYRCLLGGNWLDVAICGVRASKWSISPLVLDADCSARGACEPSRNTL